MRVTIATKSATRQRILEAAKGLFLADGWNNTTTRGIAIAAGIATGTLFNYFPTKEAIAAALIAEALEDAAEEFGERTQESSLEADLFTLVWSSLRKLRDYRRIPRTSFGYDFQSAGALIAGERRRCLADRSPRTGRCYDFRARLSRSAILRHCATVLDTLSRYLLVLGSG